MTSELHSKKHIIENIGYTELVYGRINKKLSADFSKKQIECLILDVLNGSSQRDYLKVGKNYYVSNYNHKIRVTINSFTFRIITVDKIV